MFAAIRARVRSAVWIALALPHTHPAATPSESIRIPWAQAGAARSGAQVIRVTPDLGAVWFSNVYLDRIRAAGRLSRKGRSVCIETTGRILNSSEIFIATHAMLRRPQ